MHNTATEYLVIHKGEDKTIKVPVTKNGIPDPDLSGATITARLKDREVSTTANGAAITCADDDSGANWDAGVVAVVMTDAYTSTLTVGLFELELQIEYSSGLKAKGIGPRLVQVKDSAIT